MSALFYTVLLFPVFATQQESTAHVSLPDMLPLITGVGGLILGGLGVANTKRKQKQDNENNVMSAVLQGYNNQMDTYSKIVISLQAEVERLNEQFREGRLQWEKERAQEKNAWEKERLELTADIEKLTEDVKDVKKFGKQLDSI